jgi:RecB family exonuclease
MTLQWLASKFTRNGKVNGHAIATAIAPEPAPAPPLNNELAKVLSPSQCATYIDCSARWWFKYGADLPDRKSSALAVGIACHDAWRANYAQKVETKKDLPTDEVVAEFRSAWEQQADMARFAKGEKAEDLRDMGEGLIAVYMDQVAPTIQPALVEVDVSGKIGGVPVRGRIDVIDVDGRIIDAKTAKQKPSEIKPSYRFQQATYVQLAAEGASGECRLDTVTKTKTIAVHQQSFKIGDGDRTHLDKMYPLLQESMRSGLYVPNRSSYLCSRKHCPYAEACMDSFGGQVADE